MEKIKISLSSLFFWSFLLMFIVDCVVNYFVKIPVIIGFSIIFLPVVALNIKSDSKKQFQLVCLFFCCLSLSLFINFLRFGVFQKNISDFVLISSFLVSIIIYDKNRYYLKEKNINWFLVITLLLFYVSSPYSFVC